MRTRLARVVSSERRTIIIMIPCTKHARAAQLGVMLVPMVIALKCRMASAARFETWIMFVGRERAHYVVYVRVYGFEV